MRLLLDTHIALWALAGSRRLSARGKALIEDASHEIFVSVVSLWEIAIKRAKGRPDVPKITSALAARSFKTAGFQLLAVSAAHAVAVEDLLDVHRDPFDRLLVAQAKSEPLILGYARRDPRRIRRRDPARVMRATLDLAPSPTVTKYCGSLDITGL